MRLLGPAANLAQSRLPDSLFYRLAATAYRLRYERALLRLVGDLIPRGSTAVDVGAWWGPWTYWLSRRAGSVWSFEPNPELASFLTRVVSPNVHVEQTALSDRSGSGTLSVLDGVGRDALATLSSERGQSQARKVKVPLRRLDEYELDDVRFLKIDAEGHELHVLEGAEQTIANGAPTILVEIDRAFHEDGSLERLLEWLPGRGYNGRFERGGTWVPLATSTSTETSQSIAMREARNTRPPSCSPATRV